MKIAIVTGASSGMGKEFVQQIDRACNDLEQIWVVARSVESTEFADTKAEIVRIPLDLTKSYAEAIFTARLQTENPQIKILVNSAGFGKLGKFAEVPLDIQTDMVECNNIALMKMCHWCIPYMVKGGYIINMASVAAFMPQMRFAIYAASKAFVLSFSRALHYELKDEKISVTAVCPGPVKTAFFDTAEEYGYTLVIKKYIMAKPEKVVALALADAKARKQVSVYGPLMKGMRILTKLVPKRVLLDVYDKMV